jgi:hypothetical protein
MAIVVVAQIHCNRQRLKVFKIDLKSTQTGMQLEFSQQSAIVRQSTES